MRLKFKKGEQKKILKNFKQEKNLTWEELAKKLKIKPGKLKSYVYESSLLPEKIFHRIDPLEEYSNKVVKKFNEGWGKVKGGNISQGRTKRIKIPKESNKLAEFYGIMLGDGCSHRTSYYKTRNEKRGTYSLRIVGDSRFDRDYLLKEVSKIIKELFGIDKRIKEYSDKNVIFVEFFSVKLVEFFESKGFSPGNKIKNHLGIPLWIKQNKLYLKSCLRGLYDTDGSVYKLTNQNSHQICFTNANKNLLEDVKNSLKSLGINCSEISKRDIYITKKSELQKFLKEIGFRNNKHLNKVKMFKMLNQ